MSNKSLLGTYAASAVLVLSIAAASIATAGTITVTSATYGGNCHQPRGNVSVPLKQACNGRQSCTYIVRWQTLGDPAVGCAKDFIVDWQCGDGSAGTAAAPPEAGFGKKVELRCVGQAASDHAAPGGISVTSATYGATCHQPHGNVTNALKHACNGKPSCNYVVRWQTLGDPAVGCAKDFSVSWQCPDGSNGTAGAPPEAGFGRGVALRCPALR